MWSFLFVCNRSKSSSLSLNVPWESYYYIFICPSYLYNFLSTFLNLLGHPNRYKIILSSEELTGRWSKTFGSPVLGVCGACLVQFPPLSSLSLFSTSAEKRICKRICLQCRRPGFDPWVRKILWKRKWQPTPVFLPGESHIQRSQGRGGRGATVCGVAKSWTRLSG